MRIGQLSFEINSHYQNLSIIRNIIRNFLDIENVSTLDKVHFISVVDELSTNAIEHAYKNADTSRYNPIQITVDIENEIINFTIEDYGEGFKEDSKSKDEGGMGLNIVRSIVSDFKIIKRKRGTKINIIKEIKKEE